MDSAALLSSSSSSLSSTICSLKQQPWRGRFLSSSFSLHSRAALLGARIQASPNSFLRLRRRSALVLASSAASAVPSPSPDSPASPLPPISDVVWPASEIQYFCGTHRMCSNGNCCSGTFWTRLASTWNCIGCLYCLHAAHWLHAPSSCRASTSLYRCTQISPVAVVVPHFSKCSWLYFTLLTARGSALSKEIVQILRGYLLFTTLLKCIGL